MALGVGIYSAAFRKDTLSPEAYAEMVGSMTLTRAAAPLWRASA